MKKKKILILGISSFGGASFANYLLNKSSFDIIGTYSKKKKLPFSLFLKKNKNFRKIKLFKVNLNLNGNQIKKVVQKCKPDYVIDFASICMVNESWLYPELYFKINFSSKINFIKNLYNQKKLRKYIYISTPEIFGSNKNSIVEDSRNFNPSTPYAVSKLSLELLLDNYINNLKYKIIIARFSNFYGCGQPMYRLIPKLIYCINNKLKFPLHGDGNTKRDFISEEDFNSGILKLIKSGQVGKKYHFSGEKYFRIREIIKEIIKLKKYSWKKLIVNKQERAGKDKNYYLNCRKTKNELKWKCKFSLTEGLRRTINYYDNINEYIKLKDLNFKVK